MLDSQNQDERSGVWQAASMRVTVFPADAEETMRRDWWRDLFGEAAERISNKPMQRTAEGRYKDYGLSIQVDPVRVQMVLAPRLNAEMELPKGLPTLSDFPTAIQTLSPLADRWLEKCPAINRLAFGAVLVENKESLEVCYQRLGQYLPDVKIDPHARDFMYRINRQRLSRSGVADLWINRLSTWSAIPWKLEMVSSLTDRQVTSSVGFACMLDLDINTAAEYEQQLPHDRLRDIWKELIALGREIAHHGNLP